MDGSIPRITIGLPVYNGANYLAQTLDSLLGQTYSDFELIIADNASSDATQDICRTYAAKDKRVRYIRNEQNLGAARNYNQLFELSSSEYFKWAAHDDLCEPRFLESCVEVLDRDASVVLCYSWTHAISENGRVITSYRPKPKAGSRKPRERFYEFVCIPHPCVAVFGVMRSSALRKTGLFGNYSSADRPFLGELSLIGRFYEIPEYLFLYRNHPQQSWRANPTVQSQEAWWDPARAGMTTLPHWRLLYEHFVSVRRASLSWSDRGWCYLYLLWWIRRHWRQLARNLALREDWKV